jgi:predicted nucleotidyltransferase
MPTDNYTEKSRPFKPYLWQENRRKELEAYEALRLSVLGKLKDALTDLGRNYQWDAVYVFGSVIKPGKFQPRSDVDVAVKGLDKFRLYSFIGDISAIMERDVDVIVLEECHFSESIIKKGAKWNPGKNEFL